jgi:hypothetical protein
MPRVHVESSALLDAPAAAVYAILADYRVGHPSIRPDQFSNLVVERGGTGDGTIIRFDVTTSGTTRSSRAAITEPEPGRVLVESDLDRDSVTRFVVEPVHDDGQERARVTISTDWSTPGPRGWIERLVAPAMLRRIYAEELRNLEAAARSAAARARS